MTGFDGPGHLPGVKSETWEVEEQEEERKEKVRIIPKFGVQVNGQIRKPQGKWLRKTRSGVGADIKGIVWDTLAVKSLSETQPRSQVIHGAYDFGAQVRGQSWS